MKPFVCLLISLFVANLPVVSASEVDFGYGALANKYFKLWVKTQSQNATKQDLEGYLSLLSDNVVWQHIPYQPSDERKPNGKQILRKGMTRWLAVNTEYSAKLIDVMFGGNVIVIKYQAKMKLNDDNGKVLSIERNHIHLLELENGKVAIIRVYGK